MSVDARAIPHRRAWVAATAAFLIHSIEEKALDLPAWTTAHPTFPWLNWMAPKGVFSIATGVLSLVVGAVAVYAIATGPGWSRRALQVLAIVMLANAASHIALSLATDSAMPGVATAALVIFPVMLGVLWAIRRPT